MNNHKREQQLQQQQNENAMVFEFILFLLKVEILYYLRSLPSWNF